MTDCQVVEAVPNFSEGRDPDFVGAVADAFTSAGCEVLHTTMDPDHHRSVVTAIGSPRAVETGAVATAEVALRRIDLRDHAGVHPRVGALDVLPFVPLHGIGMEEVVRLAHRVGNRIAGLGIPVQFYGRASRPPGRGLAAIRRRAGEQPRADLAGRDPRSDGVHPVAHRSAGTTCVGARELLLAWNVDIEGVSLEHARAIAARVREAGGGFAGLRALALRLPRQRRTQISMNLEDPAGTDPNDVFRAIAREVRAARGRVSGTEVIGMCPDQLAGASTVRAMGIRDWSEDRILSRRLAAYVEARGG